MDRIRSPGYPSISLGQAVDLAAKLHDAARTGVIYRDAAAKDMGFAGPSGHSAKMLSNLSHFNLIEKAGKGGIRVSDTAVRIIHPRSEKEKLDALNDAASAPELFAEIRSAWPDGVVSENVLRSHLIRGGFSSAAVAPAIRSYMETLGFLQQSGAIDSHGHVDPMEQPSVPREAQGNRTGADAPPIKAADAPRIDPYPPRRRNEGAGLMDNERVIFVDEIGPTQYLKLVANGDLDESLLEALEAQIQRLKQRLVRSKSTVETAD